MRPAQGLCSQASVDPTSYGFFWSTMAVDREDGRAKLYPMDTGRSYTTEGEAWRAAFASENSFGLGLNHPTPSLD